MPSRRQRLLARIAQIEGEPDPTRLCQVCADVTGSNGAGLALVVGDALAGAAYTTDDVSAHLEELQFALGEGPCIDAHRDGRPVLVPDLAAPAEVRWPAFVEAALVTGARAIFGFPVRIGEARLGALDLYRDHPGALDGEQHADALVLADIAARSLLMMQANAPSGTLAAELIDGADLEYVVHQASGMVAAQLDVSVAHALLRLRAYAFGNERPLREVAAAVVARQLRFSHGSDGACEEK
jgi:GAF domain-containing protein